MTFVTAEISCHWAGDLGILREIAIDCKRIGFDAVKLQALSPQKISNHTELHYYEDSSVSIYNVEEINKVFKSVGIEWYCTPTYADAVEFLDPYVNRYKISVAGSIDEKLKDRVFSTGKQVIISTQKPFKTTDPRIKNLYCVPIYPTSYGEINFNIIPKFDGYSNHCRNPMAILKAVEMGAEFIEFHVTPSKDFFLIDNAVSFTMSEAKDIVRGIRIYESWNNGSSPPNFGEVSQQSISKSGR